MKIAVLYEDSEVMVLDKPSGMVVNRSETADLTMQDWLVKYLELDGVSGELMMSRGGLAHRLDKETSGCVLVGKNEVALRELMRQFKDREVEKMYLALVHGWLEPREGVVKLPIARSGLNRQKRVVSWQGKSAETRWSVVKYLRDDVEKYSLVRLWPKTGRTHQIRVHMKHLKHPLFGDLMYLSSKKLGQDRKRLSRHFLHAEEIGFEHPKSKERMVVRSPLPSELKTFLGVFDVV